MKHTDNNPRSQFNYKDAEEAEYQTSMWTSGAFGHVQSSTNNPLS